MDRNSPVSAGPVAVELRCPTTENRNLPEGLRNAHRQSVDFGPFEVDHEEVVPLKASSAVLPVSGGDPLCGRVVDGIVAVVRGPGVVSGPEGIW
jgi:hypothetical protein